MEFSGAALKAARSAGDILKRNYLTQFHFEGKGKHDVVTDTDRQSENLILSILQECFPEHTYVTEESGTIQTSSEYCWYIDPLDGTSHFITGNPYFSVSIALAFRSEVILGVIYNPVIDELYSAEKGKGVYLNGVAIGVNSKKNLEDAIIATAYSAIEEEMKQGLETIEKLALKSRKVLINFSPAMDLCNLARGRLDGVVTRGTTPEDHAAGSLMVIEAGGKVENFDNDQWDVSEKGIIASNGFLHSQIVELAR